MGDVFDDVESMEPVDVENAPIQFGKIEEDLGVPHWKLDQAALITALQPFKEIGGVANNNVVTKSVYLERKDGKLYLRGNNKDVYLQQVLKIENVEQVLDTSFSVSISDLDLLVRRCYSKVQIHMPEKGMAAIRLHGSDFFLDIVNVGSYLFDFVQVPAISAFKPLQVGEFQDLVKIMSSAMKLSVRPEDRKVIISNDNAYGSFLISAVRIPFKGLPAMVLRSTDLTFLRQLSGNQEDLKFAEDKDRIFFSGSSFDFSTLKSDLSMSEVQKSLEESFSQAYKATVSVDLAEFKEVIFLLSKLSNTTGMVDFVSDSGVFYVEYMTKSGRKSKFKVGSGDIGGSKTFSVEALRKSLSLLTGIPMVTINTVEGGVIVDFSGRKILLGTK